MSLFRRNPRRDANEKPIVAALEAQGFVVTRISGSGVPDLLLCKGGQMWLAEVKMPKGRFKPAQLAFQHRWSGPPILTLRSIDDALRVQLLACERGER